MRLIPTLLSFALFTACGSGAPANPIAGKWHFEGAAEHGHDADGGHDHVLEFDSKTDKFVWCCEDGGTHDDFDGTYRLEGGTVTLKGTWKSTGKAETVTGTLQDKQLNLQFARGSKSFHQH